MRSCEDPDEKNEKKTRRAESVYPPTAMEAAGRNVCVRAVVNGGHGYDEVKRRGKRQRTEARYVERRKGERGRNLKRGIVVGPVTVERIVRGRYEWRDAAYRPMGGERGVIWQGSRTWDPGR